MPDAQSSLAMLRQNHTFPGPYRFKVIGENSPAFLAAVLQNFVVILGPQAHPEIDVRESAQKNHQAISCRILVPDAEAVLALYTALQKTAGVKFVL